MILSHNRYTIHAYYRKQRKPNKNKSRTILTKLNSQHGK